MKAPLLIITLALVLITSGCVRETGDVVINFTDLNISGQEASLNISGLGESSEAPEAVEEPSEAAPEESEAAGNATAEEADPCASVVCDDSITTCPDGTAMTCGNTCDPETGSCTTCIPDCTGHDASEECELECGTCEVLDEEACECIIILSCDGNGICEGGEWPDGQDCLAFGGCDDSDGCTLDVFNFNYQSCNHVDICCDDSDDCTLDEYNYTAQECQHTNICCSGAEAIIQGATYETGDLNLYVNNRGGVDLTFDVLLTFENGSITKPSGTYTADAGELATFSISEVPYTLTEAMIQSKECEEVQDFVGRQWIIGLGEEEEPGDVNITHIEPEEEIVTLEGYAIDMTGWTIEDVKFHVYFFPDGFVIDGPVYLHTFGNETDNNDTALFWGRLGPVWNNDHDNATLKNELGEAVSTYEY